MSELEEKTLKTKEIYHGKIITLHLDEVELPNGKTATREIVKHPGAVAIMALTSDQRMIFVRQFRKPLEKTILEIPAGKLEKGEDPKRCAERELLEETGYTAKQLKQISAFYTSPGFANEFLYLFEAEDLVSGQAEPDEDEFVELTLLNLKEAFEAIERGEIIDAKTVLAVYYWQNQQLQGK
ncbi:ADP-ribose pyrophosphatase [Ammoniphilus resinae]|uniref:ADP-ribose pyrophosphatase n=2 Tax=Ammoniphilus resinae TaxID=861532 RepID=A0ABS4GTU2_9BACL|nr:NUDIX hydrolase [Ammoniphilus resinae]MBP1933537.1 ADP-ribose pyrophosphatase [Ammoniphilus resinae]